MDYLVSVKKFLNQHYRRDELLALAQELNCPKTSLIEWYEGRVPGFKNLIYIKKLAAIHGVTLDDILFNRKSKTLKVLDRYTFKDGNKKYRTEIKQLLSTIE